MRKRNAKIERRWRLAAIILGAIVSSIGCSPATMMLFLNPWNDHSLPPLYELKTSKKFVTVVLNTFFANVEIRPELLAADRDLNNRIANHLQLRFRANQDPIKIISDAQVRQFLNQPSNPLCAAADVGKEFEADYVITLEINALSLRKEKSWDQFYLGNADIHVTVTKMEHGGAPDWEKSYRCNFPETGPMHASEMSVAQFRTQFFEKIARDVSRYFARYPREEQLETRHSGDYQ
jgi:hypothetical protein